VLAAAAAGANVSPLLDRLCAGEGEEDVDLETSRASVAALAAKSSTVEARRSRPFSGDAPPMGGKYSCETWTPGGPGGPADGWGGALGNAWVVGVPSAADTACDGGCITGAPGAAFRNGLRRPTKGLVTGRPGENGPAAPVARNWA
jgi:hypothetical protein